MSSFLKVEKINTAYTRMMIHFTCYIIICIFCAFRLKIISCNLFSLIFLSFSNIFLRFSWLAAAVEQQFHCAVHHVHHAEIRHQRVLCMQLCCWLGLF